MTGAERIKVRKGGLLLIGGEAEEVVVDGGVSLADGRDVVAEGTVSSVGRSFAAAGVTGVGGLAGKFLRAVGVDAVVGIIPVGDDAPV